jgi:predicted transcriptional regulator
MTTQVIGVQAATTVRDFFDTIASIHRHQVYPVFEGTRAVASISLWELSGVPADQWTQVQVGSVAHGDIIRIPEDADLGEAVRLLTQERRTRLLLVTSEDGTSAGIITHSDVLQALEPGAGRRGQDE